MIPFGHSGLCRGAPCFLRIPALPEKVGLEHLRDLIRAETAQTICVICGDRALHTHDISANPGGMDALAGMPLHIYEPGAAGGIVYLTKEDRDQVFGIEIGPVGFAIWKTLPPEQQS